MPQEDKIKREIDRIGLVLAKLLSTLLHKDFQNTEEEVYFSQQLKSELGIDVEAFLALEDSDALRLLVSDRKFTTENLRQFGNLLYELGHRSAQRKEALLNKALSVYSYISANAGGTLFLDVEYRLKELR